MKKVLLVIAIGVVAAALWSARRGGVTAPGDGPRKLVTDRIWIDHVPRGERDTIHVFVAVSEHAIGMFQTTSQWRGGFEAFRFEIGGGEMRVVYPQTGDRETVRPRARRCNEQGMDFCLELDGASRGVKRYYSREGWEIRDPRDLDAIEREVAAVRAELGAGD